ncbi:hypothetical protein KP004_07865 [Geomonas oryzisoli]|uniref:Uncharacterized protein n=1 Tax=Geomonas oryzisoli TaxID=2847992 RepID=A0ABX8JBC5_9BACT|nr:hypothetical protein [Geomonas oryzisoli]QWV95083.1 hypothetical protein KP004_07865 [Geomonas oryzisoli]
MSREPKARRLMPANNWLVLLVVVASFWLFSAVVTNFLERCQAVVAVVVPGDTAAQPDPLPRGARAAIEMLHAAAADRYRFSAGVAADGAMMQRLVEGAYPLVVADEARYLVRLEGEPSPVGCDALARRKGVALDLCR